MSRPCVLVYVLCLLSGVSGELYTELANADVNMPVIDLWDVFTTVEEVTVTGTSVAVIDSQVSFVAKFKNHTFPPRSLQYVWSTDACNPISCRQETYGGNTSSVNLTLSTYDALTAGFYKMNVNVLNKTTRIGKGIRTFQLTDKLNGRLVLSQNLTVTPPTNAFSTSVPLRLNASMSDTFGHLEGYHSVWKILGPLNYTLKSQNLSVVVPVKAWGQYEVSAMVTAQYNITDHVKFNHTDTRDVEFVKKVTFYDPVKEMNVFGDRKYTKGRNLTMIIECSGSPPFSFNLSMYGPNNDIVLRERSHSGCCMLRVTYRNLSTVGTYTINYSLLNDVSYHHGNISITVEKPPNVATDDAMIVLCILIGLASPAVIIYIYLNERSRGQSIEAANFSFHPFTEENGTFANLRAKLKKCCLRLKPKHGPPARELRRASSMSRQDETDRGDDSRRSSNNTGASYGTIKSTDQPESSNRCSTPWLEQSSENPSTSANPPEDRYQSHWLIENTSPIRSDGPVQDEESVEQDMWRPVLTTRPAELLL